MYQIARASGEERGILFQNTAAKKGMNAAIIEKDFWVCLVLDYLFSHCRFRNALIFKGGTSLSKVYSLIDRFSEDIDLILDWRVVGYSSKEPWYERSNTQQQKFLNEVETRVDGFLEKSFLSVFRAELSELTGTRIDAYQDKAEPGTIKFRYPRSFDEQSILQEIRLEIGALAAWSPSTDAIIQPYAAECYPTVFCSSTAKVRVTTAERTFWEKATILHQEAHRPEGSEIPGRYSRHYYDLYCMAKKGILEKAMLEVDLLRRVAEFKQKFYPRKWAKYELARIGSLKLIPASHSINRLHSDYEKMRAMIYGTYPDFDEMMKFLSNLEEEINRG